MNRRRLVLGTLGVGSLVLAVSVGGDSLLAAVVRSAVTALGNDYLLLAVVAIAAVVVATVLLLSGRSGNVRQTSMPEPERPTPVPAPGDGFDEQVSGLRFQLPLVGRPVRRTVRERLRAAAVEAVLRSERCSRAEAERRVSSGAWTDDPVAAAFLSEGSFGPTVSYVTALLDGETVARRRARRTADEITSRTWVGGPSDE